MVDLKLHELQRENLLNDGKMFLLPIDDDNQVWLYDTECAYIDEICPVKVYDEFYTFKDCIDCDYLKGSFCEALMDDCDIESGCENHTKHIFYKVKSIKCVRVQDLYKNTECLQKITGHYMLFDIKSRLDTIFGKDTYEQNPYMFLVEVE